MQGQSVLDPSRELPATLPELLSALLKRKLRVYEELAAQVRHKHTHLLPPVLHAVARVAHENGIQWVRRPFDFGIDRRARMTRSAFAPGMRVTQPGFGKTLAKLKTTDHFTGFLTTGSLDEASLTDMLERLPEGLTELMCHPGRLGPELRAAKTRPKESREIELSALISPEARRTIERRGIGLVDYTRA